MRLLKQFITGGDKNIAASGVIWNIIASGLYSCMSAILLIVVSRVNGKSAAGLFAITFSISQMMYTIGNYGMRNYQSSDIKNRFSFRTYLYSRYITSFIMFAFAIVYMVVKDYNFEKAVVFMLLCFLKATDAIGDVYEGQYQLKDRLDIGAKTNFVRVFTYMIAFCVAMIITKNLVIALIISIIISCVILFYFIYTTKYLYEASLLVQPGKDLIKLLFECFPLCAGSYMLVYLCNAPKNAIDAFMSSDIQAVYNYLFMPCFVINLLVQFAVRPVLLKLSESFERNDKKEFFVYVAKIIGLTIVVTLIVLAGGYLLGCPILSIIYGTKLNPYRPELMVLLLGGGIYALALVLHVVLTVMRHQYMPMIGFIIACLVAYLYSTPLVESHKIMGASISYVVSNLALLLSFSIMILICGKISFTKKVDKE